MRGAAKWIAPYCVHVVKHTHRQEGERERLIYGDDGVYFYSDLVASA